MAGLPKLGDESDEGTPSAPMDPTKNADEITDGTQQVEDEKNEIPLPPPPPESQTSPSASQESNQGGGKPIVPSIQAAHSGPPPSAALKVGTPTAELGGKKGNRGGGRIHGRSVGAIQSNLNQSSLPKTIVNANPLSGLSAGSASVTMIQPLDDIKDEALESVDFTALLRQVDVGLDMTELLKEVIRKYSKHQNADATKLQEIYGKMKNVYSEMDGMREFADVCNLTHKLILETVQQQKVLAEFLANELVPKLQQHLQEKQQAVQILKRENQQAELKLQGSINQMNKVESSFKSAAKKARAAADPTPRKKTDSGATMKKKFIKGIRHKMNKSTDMTEEEELYVKADRLAEDYEASVMTANHAAEKHLQVCRHFKYRLRAIEESRMKYCTQQMQLLADKHKAMFDNSEIEKLRQEVIDKADKLDSTQNFDTWVGSAVTAATGKARINEKFVTKNYDYENVFYSLEDAMKVTRKLRAQQHLNGKQFKIPNNVENVANVPIIMSVLCQRVKECDGFKEEGIFRVNASKNELETMQRRLYNHNYEINTNNAHLPAHMLKEWLRHLKDSLIPGSYYDVCIDMAKKGKIDPQRLDVFISQLPEVNRDSLRYLVSFLKELLKPEYTKQSKMNVKNIAIVFAPTVLRCPSDDMQLMLTNSEHEQAFFIQLVEKLNT